MVEIISPLASHLMPGRHGVERKGQGASFREVTGRDLVQVGWWPDTGTAVKATLAHELSLATGDSTRIVSEIGQITAFPVSPDKLWLAAPGETGLYAKLTAAIPAGDGVVTELGHARTVLRLSGLSARDVLARHIAIDLDPAVFPPGSFASTAIHQIGTMLHYARDLGGVPLYDLYLTRSFALSLFEGLCATADGFGYTLEA